MPSLFSSVVHNTFSWAFSKSTIKLLSFAFTIFVVRWLGDAMYGQYALIWSYITVFAMFSDAGLGLFAIREIAQTRRGSQYLVGNIILLRLGLALITMILIAGLAWITGYSDEFLGYLVLASTILLLYAIQDPLDILFQAVERFDLAAIATIVGQLFFIGAALIFLLLGWQITGLIIAALLNVLVSILVAVRLLKPYKEKLQWQIAPTRWLGFVRASFSFGLIKVWLSWSLKIDLIILSWFWMDSMIGWYGAAYNVILGIVVVSNAINTGLYPVLSRQYSQNSVEMPRIYEFGFKYLLVISLPITISIYLTADQWVALLFGPDFAPVTAVLVILIWVTPLAFVSEFLRYILLATQREGAAVRALGLAVVINIALNLWLIPHYGFLAAALVAVITEAILVLLYVQNLYRELQSLNFKDMLLKPGLVTLALMAIMVIAPDQLPWQIALGGAVYILSIILLKVIQPAEYWALLDLLMLKKGKRLPIIKQNEDIHMPLVSVFIPVYNGESFVAQAIESVLTQSYQDYELIIINDGSTDNTAQLLKQYESHPKISLYHNAENLGVSPTWNIGVNLCQGELIAKLDADDFYEPHQLETVVEFFQKHRNIGLIFSGCNLIYADGRSEPEMPFLRSWVHDRSRFLTRLLKLCVIRAPTAFVNRRCYDELGGVIEQMKLHSDWELWIKIAANYPVGYIARRLANYRMSHGTNITAQAAVDGRSMEDLKLWLALLARNELPYTLSPGEENTFRWGIYALEMHFAAMALIARQEAMHQAYVAFAEHVLFNQSTTDEIERMRHVYLNLHRGILTFRAMQFKEARHHLLQAIKTGPSYCTSLWIWSKLLLTFLGRTKWGIVHK